MTMQSLVQSQELTEGTSAVLFTAEDWVEVVFWHTADTAGDLYLSTSSQASSQGSGLIPRNVPIGPIRVSPGTRFAAVSVSGPRRINWMMSPVPWPVHLLERVVSVLNDLSCVLQGMVR